MSQINFNPRFSYFRLPHNDSVEFLFYFLRKDFYLPLNSTLKAMVLSIKDFRD